MFEPDYYLDGIFASYNTELFTQIENTLCSILTAQGIFHTWPICFPTKCKYQRNARISALPPADQGTFSNDRQLFLGFNIIFPQLRYFSKTSKRISTTIGFATCPFIPAL